MLKENELVNRPEQSRQFVMKCQFLSGNDGKKLLVNKMIYKNDCM